MHFLGDSFFDISSCFFAVVVVVVVVCPIQEALEVHDGASKGKYTIGLGQDCMAFCTDVEDIISMRL